jgi:hypothetical protein
MFSLFARLLRLRRLEQKAILVKDDHRYLVLHQHAEMLSEMIHDGGPSVTLSTNEALVYSMNPTRLNWLDCD